LKDFWNQLLGRDSHSRKMSASSKIKKCQNALRDILETGLIDKDFDDERHELRQTLDSVCDRLYDKIIYSNWWEDWRVALEKQQKAKKL
jgi:hypothetical protein